MTPAGWWILIISVGSVLAVFLICLWLVFTVPQAEEKLHGFESELPDPDEAEPAPAESAPALPHPPESSAQEEPPGPPR